MLVKNVSAELDRIKKEFPDLKVLQAPITIQRRWGKTTSAMLVDTENIFLELLEIEEGSPYDPRGKKAPEFHDVQWLHFMVNCVNYDATLKFYQSFGLKHDDGVNFRPEVGFYPTREYYARQMDEGFGFDWDGLEGCGFLRKDDDVSGMHLELMKYKPGSLKDPSREPTWGQKGICRYCFRVPDYAASLAKQKEMGTKMYIEDQRGCLEWGDTQWFFFGDLDGNILTQEQWFPCRFWGEKD
jgi:catechol 2,3-dioxygenase-like lactoylglutathione lyase family enzyme